MAEIIEVLKADRDRLLRDDQAAGEDFPTPISLLQRLADLNRRIAVAERYLSEAVAEQDVVTTSRVA